MCVCEDVLKLDAPLLGVYYNTDSSRNPKPYNPYSTIEGSTLGTPML